MRRIRFRISWGWRGVFSALIGIALCASLVSCRTPDRVETEPGEATPAQPESPHVFRSEHYVVYIPSEKISAEALADQFLGGWDRAWVIEDANGASVFNVKDVVVIPLREENPGGLTKEGYQTVPILCYRGFVRDEERQMHIRADILERQMRFLKEHGYRVVGLDDLLAFLQYRKGLPQKAVLIAVEGANPSVYEIAYPILRAFDYPAVLFVPVETVGAYEEALSWEQIREMKEGGWEVGVHVGAQHDFASPSDPVIDPATREKVRESLSKCKRVLDEKLDQETMVLAFPFTRVTPGILHLAESLGYRLGVTVQPGANPFFADPLALRREQVFEGEGVSFQARLKTFESMPLPEVGAGSARP